MKKTIFFIILAVMLSINSVSVHAAPPYESYLYSYWGEPLKSPQTYLPAITVDGKYLGVGSFTQPADLCVGIDNRLYLLDTGNNRIIVIDENWNVVNIISSFSNKGVEDHFKNPQGIFVTGDHHIIVADTDNSRIVILDRNGALLKELGAPDFGGIGTQSVYKPIKVAMDSAERLYIITRNETRGLIELNDDGKFSGFLGATKVVPNPLEILWRRFSTKAQRERMQLFVPTEYNNISIDKDGFLYVTTSNLDFTNVWIATLSRSKSDVSAPIRKLNPAGIDVLRREGSFPPVGDVKMTWYGSYSGSSLLVDVYVDEYGNYSVLDGKKGRVFSYDYDGNLYSVFGGPGNKEGSFSSSVALDCMNGKFLVLDKLQNSITVFEITPYGKLITDAIKLYRQGLYDESTEKWMEVLEHNANCEIAYAGIGKAYLKQGNYVEAMACFKLGNEREYYSKAFQLHRRNVIEQNSGIILLCIILFIFLVKVIKKLSRLPGEKTLLGKIIEKIRFSFHITVRPFSGFWDMKYEKKGSMSTSVAILALLVLTYVMRRQATGFLFNYNDPSSLNIFLEISSVLVPFLLWCISNYCLTTLMEGEGTFKDIAMSTSYAMVPLIAINLPLILLSHCITLQEGTIYSFFSGLSVLWSAGLLLIGTMTVHQYTMTKTVFTTILIIVGMLIIIFIGLLFFSVVRQMVYFVYAIYQEIVFRF